MKRKGREIGIDKRLAMHSTDSDQHQGNRNRSFDNRNSGAGVIDVAVLLLP
jgi:hypothetical protein